MTATFSRTARIPARKAQAAAAAPTVSVVIPTFNRSRLLERTLDALDTQAAEVIVVDDGSTDDTAEVVANHPRVVYLRQDNAGPAAARNRGWFSAHGRIIAFTDDDTLPDARWVADLEAAFAADPSLDAVGGTVRPLQQSFLTRFVQSEQQSSHGVGPDGGIKYLVTANCAYRRDTLVALGGFDERFPAASGEDTDLTMRAQLAGFRMRLIDGAVVLHDHPTRLRPILKTYLKHGRSRRLVVDRSPGSGWCHGRRDILKLGHWRARYRSYRAGGLDPNQAVLAIGLRIVGLLVYGVGMAQTRRHAPRRKVINVSIACPGTDHVARGYERVSRELANLLGSDSRLKVTLAKGSGRRRRSEPVLPALRRDRPLAQWMSRALSSSRALETEARRDGRPWPALAMRVLQRRTLVTPYDVEAATFGVSLLIRTLLLRPHVLVIEDVLTARIVSLGRALPGWRTKILFVDGAPWPPPYPFADVVQHVTPVTMEQDPGPDERKALVPLGTVVPEAVSPEQVTACRARFGLPHNGKIVVSLGTMLDSHKRHLHLIREVAQLPEPRPFLVIAGAPNVDRARIEATAEELLGTRQRVMHVDPDEVQSLLACADAFVLASLREGFGLVYLEALAAGLPTITHDDRLQRWLLESFGDYVDMQVPGDLANRLSAVLAREDRWSLSDARRTYTANRFSWDALRDDYVTLVRRIAGARD
jgi:GT2 family glycosyltransferase